MPAHGGRQREQAVQIRIVIGERLGDRFADGFQGREVNHGIDAVLRENRFQHIAIAHVAFIEDRFGSGNGGDALDHFFGAVAEIVQADDVVSGRQQRAPGVGTDITGRTGQQNGFLHTDFIFAFCF